MANLNLDALRDLHESANCLLRSPAVRQQSLPHHERWIYDASEVSLTMLDVCSISKDVLLLLMKEHIQDLRCTLRRSNTSEPGEYNPVSAYNLIKRKLKKETVKCLRSLKALKSGSIGLGLQPVDHRFSVVEDLLREVRLTIVAMVGSISTLVSIPWPEGKSTSRSIATKFLRSRGSGLSIVWDRAALQRADKRLEAVEIMIEDLGFELECMFRRLVQTRVSLLNILTC